MNKFIKGLEESAPPHLKYIDLCCGIGSFHYSMKKNFPNLECVLASDIMKDAVDTYEANYGITPEGDLQKIDYTGIDADIVFSGNPCQSFSQIGKHGGLEDERGNLFLYIIDNIMSLNKYPIFVFENVSGLISHDNGNTFKYIHDKITSHGYSISYRVLLCSDYGIPQNRKRVFIVCSNRHSHDNLEKVFDETLDEETFDIPILFDSVEAHGGMHGGIYYSWYLYLNPRKVNSTSAFFSSYGTDLALYVRKNDTTRTEQSPLRVTKWFNLANVTEKINKKKKILSKNLRNSLLMYNYLMLVHMELKYLKEI